MLLIVHRPTMRVTGRSCSASTWAGRSSLCCAAASTGCPILDWDSWCSSRNNNKNNNNNNNHINNINNHAAPMPRQAPRLKTRTPGAPFIIAMTITITTTVTIAITITILLRHCLDRLPDLRLGLLVLLSSS